jgi:restriction system protein
MARRPKRESALVQASKGEWIVLALFALGLAVLIYGLIPKVANPILKAMALGFRPFLVMIMYFFGLIAFFKLISEKFKKPQPFRPGMSASADPAPFRIEPVIESNHHHIAQEPEKPTAWSLQLIRDIEWKKFEELSTAYYIEKGIRAEATPLGADGGIDIKLYQDESGNPTSIVQCKAWNSRLVGVKEVREFLGVMSHEKIGKGFYMTSADYSDDAKEVAKANNITLITGEMLLMMIQRLPEESQKKLLALATEGAYTTPSCPSCGVKMVSRTGKKGKFWGCQNYPRCRQMLHMRG